MLKFLTVASLLLATSITFAQDEVYMENQAGGYLALTHQDCKVSTLAERFPYHAYGIDGTGATVGFACYQIPPLPTREEVGEIPKGMMVIPVINLIDL